MLLIRGDLLKRYPNAIVYAHRAAWQVDGAGNPRTSEPRQLAPAATETERRANPRYPLYSAKIEPGIFLLGLRSDGRPGARPGPGRSGLVLRAQGAGRRTALRPYIEDEAVDAPLVHWDDLNWGEVAEDFAPGNHIGLPADANKVRPTNHARMQWSAGSNAAEIAFILFQDPVLVAVHAQEMLKQ